MASWAHLLHFRSDVEPFIELGIYGGSMPGSISLMGYTLILISGDREEIGPSIEVSLK